LAGCFEYGNKPLEFIKFWRFFGLTEQISASQAR